VPAAVHQPEQHRGAGRVADGTADHGEVVVPGKHVSMVKREWFMPS
jgi:hypothetical protein